MREGNNNLAAKIVEFCERLRTVYGFNIGPREAIEAVQVIEIAGVAERRRVAATLNLILAFAVITLAACGGGDGFQPDCSPATVRPCVATQIGGCEVSKAADGAPILAALCSGDDAAQGCFPSEHTACEPDCAKWAYNCTAPTN